MRAELDRVLSSPGFVDAGRLGRFLTFLVENALNGDPVKVKESVLGVEVFERKPGYNPSTDPIVRVEARRLRTRLDEYYASAGKDDPVIIDVPKGAYLPVFREGSGAAATGADKAAPLVPKAPAKQGYQPTLGRKFLMLGLCVAGLILVWTFYFRAQKQQQETKPPAGQAASLLVLPFTNLSPDKENEYFAEGLTAELTDALTKVEGLRVVTYSSAEPVQDVKEAARRYHAEAVLEGSVRKSGDRLRITAQLIDSTTGFHLWSQTYERELKDVFAIQEEIARALVNSMRVQLRIDPNRQLATPRTRNVEAYNLYLRGRFHFLTPHSAEDLQKGIGYFEQAIQADPGFAGAYAALSNSYAILGYYRGLPGLEAWHKAREAAHKALEIDGSLAEAHSALASAAAFGDWDWALSEREFKRALELNPGSADTHNFYAIAYLTPTGHLDAARNESRMGVDLDPLAFFPNYGAAWILLCSHQFDNAAEQYRKAIDLNASVSDAWWDLGMAYALAGKPQQALEQFQHGGRMREGNGWQPGIIELALLGRMDEARRKAAGLKKAPESMRPIDCARAFALTGDKDAAFAALENAYQEHEPQIIWLKVDPRFDNLHGDRRFAEMLKRIGLE